jgi:exodeoxyribonuclease VII small subunit
MTVINIEEIRSLSYEQAIDAADKCMEALEGGSLGLEEALAMAEKGKAYLSVCSEKLEAAKARIEVREPADVTDLV